MDQKILDILEDLGFEHKEIKVYLSLIRHGTSTALQIAKDTKVDRTTTYDILNKLIHKGVVSSTILNKTKHFTALDPEQLLIFFQEKFSSLELILPKLNELTKHGKDEVKCELFHGLNGLKTVIKDIIAYGKDYKVIGIQDEYAEVMGYLHDQGTIKLDNLKVKEIAIVEKGAKFVPLKNGIYRTVNTLKAPVTTVIYGEKVIFFLWTHPYFAVVVENKQFVKAQLEYFNLLWKIAK